MDELSIVIGLIVLIVIFMIYKQQDSNKQCDEYVTYFDKMYYELPKLNTVNEKPVDTDTMIDMNSIKQQARVVRNVGDTNNLMATRWASKHDLHKYNSNGSPEYSNIDVPIVPTDLQHQLKKHYKVQNNDNFKSHIDGFADDSWLDRNFDFNKKYNENLTPTSGYGFYKIHDPHFHPINPPLK